MILSALRSNSRVSWHTSQEKVRERKGRDRTDLMGNIAQSGIGSSRGRKLFERRLKPGDRNRHEGWWGKEEGGNRNRECNRVNG